MAVSEQAASEVGSEDATIAVAAVAEGSSVTGSDDFLTGFNKWFAETGGACDLEEYGRAFPPDASMPISSGETSLSSHSMTHIEVGWEGHCIPMCPMCPM